MNINISSARKYRLFWDHIEYSCMFYWYCFIGDMVKEKKLTKLTSL